MKMNKWTFFPPNPTRQQWNKLTVDELVMLAKQKRSIKHPFKKHLIDYMMKVGLR